MVAPIAGLVDTDVKMFSRMGKGRLYAYLSLIGAQLHPFHVREISFKLRILEGLAWDGVVVVVMPETILWTFQTVLPHTVGAVAHPLLAFQVSLWVVERDAHHIDHAVEGAIGGEAGAAILMKLPDHLRQTSVFVMSFQYPILESEPLK